MKKLISTVIIVGLIFPLTAQSASLCTRWSPSELVGNISSEHLTEASGIALSRVSQDRIFHVNDSGDGPFLYLTSLTGRDTQKIEIRTPGQRANPVDVEDLAYGPCPTGFCVVIADIGDNAVSRDSLTLSFVTDRQRFTEIVTTAGKITVRYPDGPHNAESIALHPNGDLLIVTKSHRARDLTHIYRLKKSQWESYPRELVLEKIGSVNVASLLEPYLRTPADDWEQMITSADISQDGSKLLLLTYFDAIEIKIDPARDSFQDFSSLEHDTDYRLISLSSLSQQEAIMYDQSDNIYYDSENSDGEESIPLMYMRCADPR